MGKEGGDLEHARRADDRAGRLLKVQRSDPSLLQEGPNCRGFVARDSVQSAGCKLLQGRSHQLVGSGPDERHQLIPGDRGGVGDDQQDREIAQELHSQGPGTWLHVRAGKDREAHQVCLAR